MSWSQGCSTFCDILVLMRSQEASESLEEEEEEELRYFLVDLGLSNATKWHSLSFLAQVGSDGLGSRFGSGAGLGCGSGSGSGVKQARELTRSRELEEEENDKDLDDLRLAVFDFLDTGDLRLCNGDTDGATGVEIEVVLLKLRRLLALGDREAAVREAAVREARGVGLRAVCSFA
ncbi:unnamed protein product [Dibothriocephalus latus]|uniref:Uncharacterized protein n=1 Tax=Dibothriocephalus latus TaxID=60516 RepID=A0A3P6TRB4_DIBLA|nr:unnamed protein product [Dibothriocephalus latus]